MRILHFNYTRYTGGASIAAARLFDAQKRFGKEVNFTSLYEVDDVPEQFQVPNSIRFRIKWFRRIQKLITFDLKGDRALNFLKTGIGNWLNTLPVDLVNFHWMGNQLIGWPDLQALRLPAVWTFHDTWPLVNSLHYPKTGSVDSRGLLEKKFRQLRKDTFSKRAARWCAVGPSKWMAGVAKGSGLFPEDQVYHIPNCEQSGNPLDLDRREAKEKLRLPVSKRIIIAGASNVGDTRKGFSLLARAWLKVCVEDTQLVLFGNSGNASSGIDGAIVLPHLDREKLRLLFHAADWLISPSLEENFSNLIVEAMLARLPVVGFRIGGTPDLVVQGQTGFLANETTEDSLAETIVRALSADSEAMGTIARKRTAQLVDPHSVVKAYDSVYESLMRKS
jgi:glycosyltransferase involved in cell wall biosynthesis